jgi:hypothetical protein
VSMLTRYFSCHKGKRKRPNLERFEQIYRTKGLTSADRSNKATLLLTVPRSHSSRLQRIHPRTCFQYKTSTRIKPFRSTRGRLNVVLEPKLYFNATSNARDNTSSFSSTDSGLEAFSHNPTDGSFAPLPDRTGANTNYLNQRFLSY